jgi:hypothetical protein
VHSVGYVLNTCSYQDIVLFEVTTPHLKSEGRTVGLCSMNQIQTGFDALQKEKKIKPRGEEVFYEVFDYC